MVGASAVLRRVEIVMIPTNFTMIEIKVEPNIENSRGGEYVIDF